MITHSDVLNSWKEIASYVGRGVRTVQRWERDLNLPVRRPRGKQRGAVIALKEDIDHWLRRPHGAQEHARRNHENHVRLVHNAQILVSRTSALIAHSDALQKQITRAMNIGKFLRTSCSAVRADRKDGPGKSKMPPG